MQSTVSGSPKSGRSKMSHKNNFWQILKIGFLAVIIISFVLPDPADARRRRRARGGPPDGGVLLRTPDPRTPTQHNNRGVELGSKGLWADAIREHEKAVEEDPYNQEFRTNLSSAHLQFGSRLLRKRKHYEASIHFREALYADPNNLPAEHQLGNCIKALGKNPDDYKTRDSMAGDFEANGNYPMAVVEYRICKKMKDDGPSTYNLGKALYKQGKIKEGYAQLMESIRKSWPKTERNTQSLAHTLMGEILWSVAQKAKQDGRAEIYKKRLYNVSVCYRRAVTVNPSNTSAVQGLISACQEAVTLANTFNNNLMMAGAYQLASDFEHAKMYYAKCWRINPSDTRLHGARRSFHLAVVSSPMASPALKQNSVMKIQTLLERMPDDPFLLYVYGKGKEELKDNDTALLAYKKAYLINPFVHPDLSQAIERITGSNPNEGEQDTKAGDAKIKGVDGTKAKAAKPVKAKPAIPQAKFDQIEGKITAGDLKGAEVDLMELVRKHPKAGKVWLMLGNVYEQQEELSQAKVAYRQAKVLKAPGAEAAFRQINISRVKPLIDKSKGFIAEKNFVKAAAILRQATRIAPELSQPHRLLSQVLEKLGDKDEAKKEKEKANELEKNK